MPRGHEDRRADFACCGDKGGGMQLLVDASIDPAGDVWVSNNWQDPGHANGKPMKAFRPAAAARASSFSTAWPSRCAPRQFRTGPTTIISVHWRRR